MWKKIIGGMLLAGIVSCGTLFAAPTNSTTYNSSTELAANGNGNGNGHSPSCGCSSCSFCDIGCSSCEEDYFTAHVDWLYWKMRRNGTDFAKKENASLGTPSHCCEADPDRDHGVRVGIGYKTCDCWDIAVDYTYWQADDKNSCNDSTNGIFATRLHPASLGLNPNNGALYSYANYEVEYHLLDIVAGYMVEAACDVTVRPFAGLRMAFIDQDMDTHYSTSSTYAAGSGEYVFESIDMDAYGFVAGVDMNYAFWDCFSVFGRFAAMVAYADFDISFHQRTDDATPTEYVIYKCSQDRMMTMIEASVGFQWDVFDCDWAKFMVAIGWEMQSWCNMADFVNWTDSSAYGHDARQNQCFGVEGLFVRLAAQF